MTSLNSVWAGVGYSVGGEIVVGHDHTEGWMMCLGDPIDNRRCFTLSIDTNSLGLGLGGSVSGIVLLGFNITNQFDVPGTDQGFDFSLDLGPKAFSAKFLKYLNDVPDVAKFAAKSSKRDYFVKNSYQAAKELQDALGQMPDGTKLLSDAHKSAQGKPCLMRLPLGTGLRVSLRYEISVIDVKTWHQSLSVI
ncbi:MAG: hypothetical protein AAFX52_15740 [Pseudomonadota bacterium]